MKVYGDPFCEDTFPNLADLLLKQIFLNFIKKWQVFVTVGE